MSITFSIDLRASLIRTIGSGNVTPAEIDAFLKDDSPLAYDKVVDRLLASPNYGPKAALYWLDLVRYAESDGFKADDPRPNAWRYRDYVIESFNRDKPFDRFIKEQVAGDDPFLLLLHLSDLSLLRRRLGASLNRDLAATIGESDRVG